MTRMSTEIECELFLGVRGGDQITFACRRDGGYIILQNDDPVGTWEGEELDACMAAYLGMIDRTARLTPFAGRAGGIAG